MCSQYSQPKFLFALGGFSKKDTSGKSLNHVHSALLGRPSAYEPCEFSFQKGKWQASSPCSFVSNFFYAEKLLSAATVTTQGIDLNGDGFIEIETELSKERVSIQNGNIQSENLTSINPSGFDIFSAK